MKKVLQICSLVLVLLTGCSSNQIGMDSLDLQHENNLQYNAPFEISGKGDALYLHDTYSNNLYYYDKDFNCIDLGSLSFIDDKKMTEENLNDDVKKYSDLSCPCGMYYYDSRIYYISDRRTIEGEFSYVLKSVDEKGENGKELMELDHYPSNFIIQKGYILIVEWVDSTHEVFVHIYNQQLEEVKVIEIEKDSGGNLFTVGDTIYINCAVSKDGKTGALLLDLNDFSTDELYVDDSEDFLLFRENSYATRSMSTPAYDDVDLSEIEYGSRIYDKKTNEVIFEVENELIGYYDEDYIYTTTLKNPNAKYRVYDFNHQLIKEINPSDSLPREAEVDVIFSTQDFDFVYRVFNNHIISGTTSPGKFEIVACSIDSGVCKVIASKPYGMSTEQ